MAKYVLLQFDNDDDAAGFMTAFENQPVDGDASVKIVAVYKKPTIFCDCEPRTEKSQRGAKWGWWLCTNKGCGKPKRGAFQQPKNLIEPEGTRTEHRRIFINIREPLQPDSS
jgi:hypothetical protein